jgi:hypothetical protein
MMAATRHPTTQPARLSGCRAPQRPSRARRPAGRKLASGVFGRQPPPRTRQIAAQLTGTHLEIVTYVFNSAPGCAVAQNNSPRESTGGFLGTNLTAREFAAAAWDGAAEGLRKTVSIGAEGALIFPLPPLTGSKAGIGIAGNVGYGGEGLTHQIGLAGGSGAGGAVGVTFDVGPAGPRGGDPFIVVSVAGGRGPGGAINFTFDKDGRLVDTSIIVGLGYGFEWSIFVPVGTD